MFRRLFALSLISVFVLGQQCIPLPNTTGDSGRILPDFDPQPQVTIETNLGNIVVELFSYQAPKSVESFLQHVLAGHYNNTIIHHVFAGRSFNGGIFTPDLVHNYPDFDLVNESNNGLINLRGRFSLYGPAGGTIGKPQFLINVSDNPDLDFYLTNNELVDFTVIGKVIEGMNIADQISDMETTSRDDNEGGQLSSAPVEDVVIIRIYISSFTDDAGDNQPPVADAGNDRNVVKGLTINLDGTNSSDPDTGETLTYLWEQTAGPDVVVTNNDQSKTTFVYPDTTEQISFDLTVTDALGETDTASVTLTPVTDPRVRLQTTMGDVVLQMLHEANEAPITSMNYMQYVEDNFYNGTIFHRIMPGFVVQGGGFLPELVKQEPLRDPIVNEFSVDRSNLRGTVSMAKLGGDQNSATSQFFVSLVDNSITSDNPNNLDVQNGGFTVFANVIVGMDVVDAMAAVDTGTQQDPGGNSFDDVPDVDIVVTSATIEGP